MRMRRRAPGERVESFRHRVVKPQVAPLADRLADWAHSRLFALREAWPKIPDAVQDRNADCWEPLLAVADAAGGRWPELARVAAVALVADARDNTRESLGVRLLADLRTCWVSNGDPDHLSTEDVLEHLTGMDESPWGDLRGKPLDARGLSRRLAPYGVKPKTVRVGDKTPKGYDRGDLIDPWNRYLPEPVVARVADVADTQPHMGEVCTTCSEPLDDVFGTGVHPGCEVLL